MAKEEEESSHYPTEILDIYETFLDLWAKIQGEEDQSTEDPQPQKPQKTKRQGKH